MKNFWLIFLIFILLNTSFIGLLSINEVGGYNNEVANTNFKTSGVLKNNKVTYTDMAPFEITSNSAFSTYFSTGSGTSSDPYIMDGVKINSTVYDLPAIKIANTTAYFVIKNSVFYIHIGFTLGVILSNVTHATFMNNNFNNISWYNFAISSSSDLQIIGNTFSSVNSIASALSLNHIANSTVSNNIFSGKIQIAIDFYNLNHLVITNNIINLTAGNPINIYNGYYDVFSNNTIVTNDIIYPSYISLERNSKITKNTFQSTTGNALDFYDSVNNTLTDNMFIDSKLTGLHIGNSTYNEISQNGFSNNGGNGLLFEKSTDNVLYENHIDNNQGDGIFLNQSSNNNLFYTNYLTNNGVYNIHILNSSGNDFLWNELTTTKTTLFSQALDGGMNNYFSYNYWSDWTGPDADNNGFVDSPYIIRGSGNSLDNFPLSSHVDTSSLQVPNNSENTITSSGSSSSQDSSPIPTQVPIEVVYALVAGVVLIGFVLILRRKK